MSEGDGKLAYDSSGEYNNGAIIGADYVDAQARIPQLGMMNWSKGSNLFPYSEDFTEWIVRASASQVVLRINRISSLRTRRCLFNYNSIIRK